jgi:kynureninase
VTTILPRKDLFVLPEGIIYLDGNSLGVLPKAASDRALQTINQEWGQYLIRAWNSAGWMDLPRLVGNRIARLIGAPEGSVATGDTLSIKVYQALAAALKMRPDRKTILSDSGNFPSDLYMAQGLIDTIGQGYRLRTVAHGEMLDEIDDDTAVVMLTHVDYRSGQMYDMNAVTEAVQSAGAVMLWDLAHSAGAVPVDLASSQAEFAVGCSYKYLNGGPGAPAFIYVRPDIVSDIQPALSGWLGHDAPFAMEHDYRPAFGTERMRVGTPPIVQLAILDAALDVWDDVDMADLRNASVALSECFIEEVEKRCPDLELASPRDPACRGSQVSFRFENGYAAIQALIARGVIGDFREPNIMRFGFTPLYLDLDDVRKAAQILSEIMQTNAWNDPKFMTRAKVT